MQKNIFHFLFTLFFFLAPAFSNAQSHTFSLGDQNFLLDGKPLQIISGEMHYARIPYQYWKDRLHKAKAMGLNTVAVYCFWNMHEPRPGQFVFSGNEDVAKFVRLAQQEGLWVLLRPGPYVCAEWEFGGYPWWLLKNKNMKVRSRDPQFLSAAKKYLDALGKQLAPLQITHGGPILMVQVENEYGSFGKDTAYERKIANMIRDAGFDVPLFTADGGWLFQNAALPGVLPGANGETNVQNLKEAVNKFHDGKGPYFIPEYYPGWLDHWGEKFVKVPVESFIKNVDTILTAGVSLNFYMFHGGTNFGFMNGANYSKKYPIEPDITSYDYDAPLSEAGVPTPKYFALREVIKKYLADSTQVPEVPPPPHFINIPQIAFSQAAPLLNNLPKPVHNEYPLNMEALNQGYGLVLYQTKILVNGSAILKIDSVRDYAVILLNGKKAGVIDRRLNQDPLLLNYNGNAQLDILVENMGRINYGHEMVHNHKGILGNVLLNNKMITGWNMYSLPCDNFDNIHFVKNTNSIAAPAFYKGIFMLKDTADTFVDMRKFGKGIVWVNGHNLGRYWYIGPQQTLYLPGCWLKKGENEIIIFEELKNAPRTISTIDYPVLDELNLTYPPLPPIGGERKKEKKK